MEQKEIWKDIPDYEGYYQVSNLGRVKGVERFVKQGLAIRHVKERFLKVYRGWQGYSCVTLCKDKKSKPVPLHRLIAEAFIPNPDNKPEIDHINTIRTDFRLENLRWVTHSENMRNPITKKLVDVNARSKDAIRKGVKSKILRKRKTAPKRVYQFNLKGEFIAEYESAREASRVTGVTAMTIAEVSRGGLRGRQSCGGYLWSRSKDIIPVYEPYKQKYKPISQYTKDWEFVKRWASIKEACETLGLEPSNINRNASGRKKCLCGGYNWKYEN